MAGDLPADEQFTATPPSAGAPHLRGLALVTAGGMVGTLIRFGLDSFIADVAGLPVGTLLLNVSGAFVLAFLVDSLAARGPDHGRRRDLRLLVGTGVLGGFTTYSLLATDIAHLLLASRVIEGIGYGLVTLIGGGLASWVGLLAARSHRSRS